MAAVSPFEMKQTMEDSDRNSYNWEDCPKCLYEAFQFYVSAPDACLDLSNRRISDAATPHIVQFLRAYPKLKTVDLSRNLITDKGAKILANNTALQTLNIACNQIGNSGAKALARNRHIESLDISNNPLGRKSCGEYFDVCCSEYEECCCNDENCGAWMKYACCPCHVIACTCICMDYLVYVATSSADSGIASLAHNTNLSTLSVRGCNVNDNGAQALGANTNIWALDVRGNNRIGPTGIRALQDRKIPPLIFSKGARKRVAPGSALQKFWQSGIYTVDLEGEIESFLPDMQELKHDFPPQLMQEAAALPSRTALGGVLSTVKRRAFSMTNALERKLDNIHFNPLKCVPAYTAGNPRRF